MTQLRKRYCPHCGFDLDPISNRVDRILAGRGRRGSSFSNVDAVTHNRDSQRFLFQEFKGPREEFPNGQHELIEALAALPQVSAWCVRLLEDGLVGWWDLGSGSKDIITIEEYRSRFQGWWDLPEEQISVVTTAQSQFFELPEE